MKASCSLTARHYLHDTTSDSHLKTPCSIERVFAIKKAEKFYVRRLNAEEAIANLYKEIIAPVTLTSVDDKVARIKKSAFCLEVIKSIPVYELYFDKEGKFWE